MKGLIIFLLLIISISCQTNNTSIMSNNLENKKMLLISDFKHSSLLPYLMVKNTINLWLKQKHIKKLSLVLEKSDTEIKAIKCWIKGNKNSIVNNFGLIYSQEDLYFLDFLREINNKLRSEKKGRVLELIGYENDETDEYFFTKNDNRNSTLDISRDERIAKKISNYYQKAPHPIIIFYGSGHVRNEVGKLCHYLKSFNSDNIIVSYGQKQVNIDYYNSVSSIEKFNNFKIISNKLGDKHDYLMIHFKQVISPHLIKLCFSKKVLSLGIKQHNEWCKLIKKYDKVIPNFRLGPVILLLSGTMVNKLDQDLSDLNKLTEVELSNRLDSPELKHLLYRILVRSNYSSESRYLLNQLGFPNIILNNNFKPNEVEWNNRLFNDSLPHIKYFSSLATLWIYDKNSQPNFCKNYIQSFTNFNKLTPSKYLEYWYKKYAGYSFK